MIDEKDQEKIKQQEAFVVLKYISCLNVKSGIFVYFYSSSCLLGPIWF